MTGNNLIIGEAYITQKNIAANLDGSSVCISKDEILIKSDKPNQKTKNDTYYYFMHEGNEVALFTYEVAMLKKFKRD